MPTHAFIGGSSGNLEQIMELLLHKNPRIRIVINAIALETVAEALSCVKKLPVERTDIVTVSVGKSKELGHYHMTDWDRIRSDARFRAAESENYVMQMTFPSC